MLPFVRVIILSSRCKTNKMLSEALGTSPEGESKGKLSILCFFSAVKATSKIYSHPSGFLGLLISLVLSAES